MKKPIVGTVGEVDENRLQRCLKIYPIFYGLSADLLFWMAINTLFLTTVKGLDPSQINSINALAIGVGIIFQLFLVKIVRKIGNKNAVLLGTILLFFSAFLNTVSTRYIGFFIAEVCNALGFIFARMDNVILIRDLNYLGREDDYVKLQTKGHTIYAFITMVLSIISGLLFNVNPYVPMMLCLLVCFVDIFLARTFYEVPINKKKEMKWEGKMKLRGVILCMILLYGLFYGMVVCGQNNSKLFIQLNAQEFLPLDKVVIYMSIFLFISRVCRLVSNLGFIKVYNRLRDRTLFLLETLLCTSFMLLLIGNFIGYNMFGIWVMAFGFFMYLLVRDPFDIYMKKTLFRHSREEVHDEIVNYIYLSRKVFTLIYGLIISMMLTNLPYVYVMALLLLIAVSYIFLIFKIHGLLKVRQVSKRVASK